MFIIELIFEFIAQLFIECFLGIINLFKTDTGNKKKSKPENEKSKISK